MRYLAAIATLCLVAACNDDGTTPTESLPPVLANAPAPEHASTGDIQIDDQFSCGSFEASVLGTTREDDAIFFDANGDLLLVQGHVRASLRFTNLTTGKTYMHRQAFNYKLDFRNGAIETDTGKFFNIKEGIHIMDVGRFVWNWDTGEVIWEAGRHDVGLGNPGPLYCQALS